MYYEDQSYTTQHWFQYIIQLSIQILGVKCSQICHIYALFNILKTPGRASSRLDFKTMNSIISQTQQYFTH